MSIFQQQTLITDESITLKTDGVLDKENIEIERERERRLDSSNREDFLYQKKSGKVLNVFETFSGIGAQKRALEILKLKFKYKYKIVATSDWDIFANISYNAIHNKLNNKKVDREKAIKFLSKFTHSLDGQTPITLKRLNLLNDKVINALYWSYKQCNNLGSIKDVTGEKLIKSIKNQEIDLITYSFPCQDLSLAGGFHHSLKGMHRGSNSRSGLIWEIGRILSELNSINKLPKFLLLENVKNINSNEHKKYYNEWVDELKKLGYSTKEFILNSKEYGLPQNRERFYAISILNCENIDEIVTKDRVHKKIIDEISLPNALRTDYEKELYRNEALNCIPNRTKSRKNIYENNKKLLESKYCGTITKRQDRHPNAGIISVKNTVLDDENRRLNNKANFRYITPREGFILMGFNEDDYEKIIKQNIDYPKEKLYNQIGNSIAVNVIIVLMKIIHEESNK